MDDGDHDDQGQLEPEEHPGHRRSCSNYQLGRHHQVPVEGSQGETIKFRRRRVTCFSKLSQNCPKVVPKLSKSGPKVVPKLQAGKLLLQVRGTPQQNDSDHVTITPRSSNPTLDITKVLQNQNVVLSLNVFLSKKKLWMPDFFFDQAKKVRGHPSGVLPAASVRFKLIRIFCKGDQF